MIAGSRDFNDYKSLAKESSQRISEIINILKKQNEEEYKVRIISGTARGADKLGEKFAIETGYLLSTFPADWNTYGKSAGYRRNAEMAKFSVENDNVGVLIAFWDGKSRGTKSMIDLAKRYGMRVFVINF